MELTADQFTSFKVWGKSPKQSTITAYQKATERTMKILNILPKKLQEDYEFMSSDDFSHEVNDIPTSMMVLGIELKRFEIDFDSYNFDFFETFIATYIKNKS